MPPYKKETHLEIMNPVEPKNAVLLVMKNIWRSVDPMNINISQVLKIPWNKFCQFCCSKAFWKHWNNTSSICLNIICKLRILSVGVSWLYFEYRQLVLAQPTNQASSYFFRKICTIWILMHIYRFSAAMICLAFINFLHA